MPDDSAATPTTVQCWQCGSDVPPGEHCVVCGHGLSEELAARRQAAGRYRANPDEPVRTISVISTLFPQLPRADLGIFRVALGLGTAIVLALTILELFPLAIVVGAAVVPLLVVVYAYEVDVYEDEPLTVVGATLAWGAVGGAITAYVARSLAAGSVTRSPSRIGDAALDAILEIVQLLVILAGPSILLRNRRFNDVLDGATFGVATAAGFVFTYTLVYAADALTAGLTPGGDTTAWLFSVVNLALLRPLLLAGVAGAVCAALWLRFRAPARDREALGPLGKPPVAVAAGAALVVAAGVSAAVAPQIVDTAARAIFAAIALLWLRQAIHLGLREEAAEVSIGEPRPCPNCGRMTPWHSFCASCGISLRALPRNRTAPRRPAEPGRE